MDWLEAVLQDALAEQWGLSSWREHARSEGGEGGSGGGEGGGSGSSGSSGDNDDDNDDDDDDDDDADKKVDWKRMARKWERQAKTERKTREAAEAKVKERETADQSEHEKAVQAAREEGEAKARTEVDKERRADRLENATLKLAGKGFKVTVTEDDEEKEVTARFADPDDAVTYIERAIRRGDLDEDDIFDEKGKIDSDALREALKDLLEEKPHLQASAAGAGNGAGGKSRRKVKGSADGGKGSSSGKSMEDMSADDFLESIREKR